MNKHTNKPRRRRPVGTQAFLPRLIASLLAALSLLSGCAGSPASPAPEPTPTTELPRFTASVGEQLTSVPCDQPHLPTDDGSRHISLKLFFFEDLGDIEMGETENRYDLSPAEQAAPGEEIPLLRLNYFLDSDTRPETVSGAADVAYLRELAAGCQEPLPDTESPFAETIQFKLGETIYVAYPNNTVEGPDGVGPCDFSRLCAIAWRYATPECDGGYTLEMNPFVELEALEGEYWKGEVLSVATPAESYRLCLQGDGLHVDFGPLEAARFLFRVLTMPNYKSLELAPFDWTPPAGEAVSLTVCVRADLNPYAMFDIDCTFWLYEDGTLACYQEDHARNALLPRMWEHIYPPWPRPYIVENAFSWETLCQVLGEYAPQ